VSHQPERKEKDCLNCGTLVAGRYCQYCGQENIVTRQGFFSLASHFISDIFHFDGKFFDTFRRLLLKPGFVPKEYILGRRQRYLDPIRMYLFTSAVFFLIFFATNKLGRVNMGDSSTMNNMERMEAAMKLSRQMKVAPDTVIANQLTLLLDTSKTVVRRYDSVVQARDSQRIVRLPGDTFFIYSRDRLVVSPVQGSDSGWLTGITRAKWRELNRKYGDDESTMMADLGNAFMHLLPYMLFLSLPFFALFLKLVYVRRKIYYSDHAVFTLYHYIFSFILLLLVLLIQKIDDVLSWQFLDYLTLFLLLYGGIYLLLSMKRFYAQGWGRTVLKFLIVNFLGLIMLLVLMLIFIILSSFQL